MSYPLARSPMQQRGRLDLDSFARAVALHPDLVRHFVTLGLLESTVDPAGQLWFAPRQLLTVARIQRLRAGLALNYAAVGLVLDLLERIAELEATRVRTRPVADRPTTGGRTWTPRS